MRHDRQHALRLPFSAEAPAVARQRVRVVAAAWPAQLVDDALLAATEIVTNAVRHGQAPVGLSVQLFPAPPGTPGATAPGAAARRSRRGRRVGRPETAGGPREVLHVEVQDAGRGLVGEAAAPVPNSSQAAAPGHAESGRGLLITAAVTSRWGAHLLRAGGGTLVWFELDGPDGPP